MADSLCRAATGAGFGTRQLYSDGEEHIAQVSRPVLLNGINDVLARGDLADRSIALTLARIPDDRRKTESEVNAAAEAARPAILGAVLDGLAMALRNRPTTVLPRLPRMADFAVLACAAAPAWGWKPDKVLATILENQAQIVAKVADSDSVARAVIAMLGGQPNRAWAGTASELLSILAQFSGGSDWPKDATRMSGSLRRVAPALRAIGVDVEMPEQGGREGRIIRLADTRDQADRSSAGLRNAGTLDGFTARDAVIH
jgi:hypothetical protein